MPKPGKPGGSTPQQAATSGASISARTLRGLGEKADALRDVDLALVRWKIPARTSDPYDILLLADANREEAAGTLDIIEKVFTDSKVPSRAWMEVSITVNHSAVSTKGVPYDAAFWSESACDKFLWPYYEGMRIWDKEYLPRLKEAFKDSAVAGILHVGESDAHFVGDGGTANIVLGGQSAFRDKSILTLEEFEAFQAERRR